MASARPLPLPLLPLLLLCAGGALAQWDVMHAWRTGARPPGLSAEQLYEAAHGLQGADDAGAAARYRWALELSPRLFAAHINLGNILDSHGQLEEAAHHYREAHAAAPRAQLAALNLGNTLNRLSRRTQAAEALSTAVQLDPSHWQASLNLGNTMCAMGQLSQAVELYTALCAQHPQHPSYLFRLAYLLLVSGERRAAAERAAACLAVSAATVGFGLPRLTVDRCANRWSRTMGRRCGFRASRAAGG
jgi:tetratricopeptide (TPR) repeat protein